MLLRRLRLSESPAPFYLSIINYVNQALRTIIFSCTTFTMHPAETTPRMLAQGYTTLFRPSMVPGLRTTLQPTSLQSPTIAPNFFSPVSMFLPISCWRMTTSVWSSLRLEVMAPADKCAPSPSTESPTQLKWQIRALSSTTQFFSSQLFPIMQLSPVITFPRMQAPFRISQFFPIMLGPFIMAPCSIVVPYPMTTSSSMQTEPMVLMLWRRSPRKVERYFSMQLPMEGMTSQGYRMPVKMWEWAKWLIDSRFSVLRVSLESSDSACSVVDSLSGPPCWQISSLVIIMSNQQQPIISKLSYLACRFDDNSEGQEEAVVHKILIIFFVSRISAYP